MARAKRSNYAQKSTTQEYFFKTPLNLDQQRMIKIIASNHISIVRGAAGSGKTFIALQEGLKLFQYGKVDQILYVRNVNDFEAWGSKGIGFLKGSEDDKKAPLLYPILDNIQSLMHPPKSRYLLAKKDIEPLILDELLGRSLQHKFVILDEGQNCPIEAVKLLLTRLGEGTKIVLLGDYKQKATRNKYSDGLSDAAYRLGDIDGVGIMEFSNESSVVRHPILPELISRYDDV